MFKSHSDAAQDRYLLTRSLIFEGKELEREYGLGGVCLHVYSNICEGSFVLHVCIEENKSSILQSPRELEITLRLPCSVATPPMFKQWLQQ